MMKELNLEESALAESHSNPSVLAAIRLLPVKWMAAERTGEVYTRFTVRLIPGFSISHVLQTKYKCPAAVELNAYFIQGYFLAQDTCVHTTDGNAIYRSVTTNSKFACDACLPMFLLKFHQYYNLSRCFSRSSRVRDKTQASHKTKAVECASFRLWARGLSSLQGNSSHVHFFSHPPFRDSFSLLLSFMSSFPYSHSLFFTPTFSLSLPLPFIQHLSLAFSIAVCTLEEEEEEKKNRGGGILYAGIATCLEYRWK